MLCVSIMYGRQSQKIALCIGAQIVLELTNPVPSLVSIADALSSWQREAVSNNPWQKHLLVSEIVCILLEQLPYQMLERGVVQTGQHTCI